MGAAVVVPEVLTMDEAKELVPEGHWHVSFEERFALSTADPKSKSATVSKRLALEAYALSLIHI